MKGWRLRSGGFATLCVKCGMAYENLIFCEVFHQKESGWRECYFCGKRLHCGCIASLSSLDLLDGGGVQCISCLKNSQPSSMPSEAIKVLTQSSQMVLGCSVRNLKDEKVNEFGTPIIAGLASEVRFTASDDNLEGDGVAKGKAIQFGENIEGNGNYSMFLSKRDRLSGSFGHAKAEQVSLVDGASFLNRDQGLIASSQMPQRDEHKDASKDSVMCEPLAQECLNISPGTSNPVTIVQAIPIAAFPHVPLPLPSAVGEGGDQNRALSALQQVQRGRHLLPKPPKAGYFGASESSEEALSHMRVPRPPGEGRGRNLLLPRYWPRITDQELQQISGDSNSTIVPLFEKVLSASDAGRIGRLVLPKACAEAYFPPISQPEGLPLTIQDARGNEWHFQFRFWPNNNSRMYVLEGVTPCIQSMQLQAGDTVTFNRIDPQGKLVMGFRKASSISTEQDKQTLKPGNGLATPPEVAKNNTPAECILNLPSQLLKDSTESRNPVNTEQDAYFENSGLITKNGLANKSSQIPSKRKGSALGSKSKRLRIDYEDSIQLKLTWEAAQDLLRPPPNGAPSVVIIDGHEFEEYEEAPVIGMPTFFSPNQAGVKSQWAQCEACSKWRKLPMDALLPSRWTCSDNTWDPERSSCSSPQEPNMDQLEDFLPLKAGTSKKSKVKVENGTAEVSDGLNTLANLAILGEGRELPHSSQATTKHPRHRPGCTCIVCIQPPSGQLTKHKQTCMCNVCLTVKRRFRTMMLKREKQLQSEKEGETACKNLQLIQSPKMTKEAENDAPHSCTNISGSPQKAPANSSDGAVDEDAEGWKASPSPLKACIDLNIQPERDEEMSLITTRWIDEDFLKCKNEDISEIHIR